MFAKHLSIKHENAVAVLLPWFDCCFSCFVWYCWIMLQRNPMCKLCKLYFQNVFGEVYRADKSMLNFLDWFEDHPDVYCRRQISIRTISEVRNIDWFNAFHIHLILISLIAIMVIMNFCILQSASKRHYLCWTYMLRNFPQDLVKVKEHLSEFKASSHTPEYTLE